MAISDKDYPVPAGLVMDEFVLRPITVADVELDYSALMETRQSLRLWQQGTWPEDDFTIEDNLKDLATMQERHVARRAYGYTVVDPTGAECLGCVYIFPIDATFLLKATVRPVGIESLNNVEAVVYFWARQSRVVSGMDARLLAALREWMRVDWKVERAVYVASDRFTQQVDLLRSTNLVLKFVLVEPSKPGSYLAFG